MLSRSLRTLPALRAIARRNVASTSAPILDERPAVSRLDTLAPRGSGFDPRVPPEAMTIPRQHPQTHGIPVGLLHLGSHSPASLNLFIHFALHAAYAFGIPASRAASLPIKRSLYTVIRSPFVHKKSQENFERVSHHRAIKLWDADMDVLNTWVRYLEINAMGGVDMRITRWERVEMGFGQKRLAGVVRNQQLALLGSDEAKGAKSKMEDIAAEIVKAELASASAADAALASMDPRFTPQPQSISESGAKSSKASKASFSPESSLAGPSATFHSDVTSQREIDDAPNHQDGSSNTLVSPNLISGADVHVHDGGETSEGSIPEFSVASEPLDGPHTANATFDTIHTLPASEIVASEFMPHPSRTKLDAADESSTSPENGSSPTDPTEASASYDPVPSELSSTTAAVMDGTEVIAAVPLLLEPTSETSATSTVVVLDSASGPNTSFDAVPYPHSAEPIKQSQPAATTTQDAGFSKMESSVDANTPSETITPNSDDAETPPHSLKEERLSKTEQ